MYTITKSFFLGYNSVTFDVSITLSHLICYKIKFVPVCFTLHWGHSILWPQPIFSNLPFLIPYTHNTQLKDLLLFEYFSISVTLSRLLLSGKTLQSSHMSTLKVQSKFHFSDTISRKYFRSNQIAHNTSCGFVSLLFIHSFNNIN